MEENAPAPVVERPRHWSDTFLESLILGGFIGVMFALIWVIVPKENANHFSQALGALIVIATLVAKSLWDRRSQGAEVTSKALTIAENAAPGGGATAGAVEAGARKGTAQGVEEGLERSDASLTDTLAGRPPGPAVTGHDPAPDPYEGPDMAEAPGEAEDSPEEPQWPR